MRASTERSPEVETYARARVPRGRTPWREAPYCVVDLELTGLDPRLDEIISFAAVPIEDGLIPAGRCLYGLVCPTRVPSEASVLIHGIRTVDLAEAPPLTEALRPLLAAMAGRILVAHSAGVERAFLSAALRRVGARLRAPILDTALLGALLSAERGKQSQRLLALEPLAASLGLPSQRPHHALGDALTTAQVFLALASHLAEMRTETVGSLARAAVRLRTARYFGHMP